MPRIALEKDQPFSLDLTLGCGQAFRWEKDSRGWWSGVADGQAIRCRLKGRTFSFEGADEAYIRHYFSLDTDLNEILVAIDRDPFIHAAIDRSAGLRLVRQPPWEVPLLLYLRNEYEHPGSPAPGHPPFRAVRGKDRRQRDFRVCLSRPGADRVPRQCRMPLDLQARVPCPVCLYQFPRCCGRGTAGKETDPNPPVRGGDERR